MGRSVNIHDTAQYAVIMNADIKAELKKFGANVRRERVAKEISQEKLAELADLHSRSLQKIEAGAINILITTAIRLRKAIGCPWDKLLR